MLNFLVEDKTPKAVSPDQILPRALRALRLHLGMDIAFIAQLRSGQRVFRYVDCARPNDAVTVGASDALEDTYCQRVIDGRLPELIADTSALDAAQELAFTRLVPVGAYLAVPIRLYDGTVFGTIGCISTEPDASLGARDLSMMRVFAEMAAEHIEADLQVEDEKHDLTVSLKTVLSGDPISVVYQPVFDLRRAQAVGFESLARFTTTPARAPNAWFADAARVGLDVALELKVLEKALACFSRLPPAVYVAFNVSPNIVISGQLELAFRNAPLDRIVLEVNEHVSIREYDEIGKAMAPLRERGLRVSVDDTGAGLSSFRHIVSLKPDIVKLPMSLTRNIDSDGARRALASALIQFANENACTIIAEGVETAAELKALRTIGITRAQGYFLGRPLPLQQAAALCRRASEDSDEDFESRTPI